MENFFSCPVVFDDLASPPQKKSVVALPIKTIWACHMIMNIQH